MKRRALLKGVAAAAATTVFAPAIGRAQAVPTLVGAVQFNDAHPFTQGLLKFEERVKALYNRPINFTLHKDSSLGLEKQYFEYMAQGKNVDYAVVSPAHMSTFAKAAPFIDAPFVFRDFPHMEAVVNKGLLTPIADEIEKKAGVRLIGYGGGGVRNLFSNKPMKNLAEIKGLKVRVQGAPIWSRSFSAIGMSPTVIAYNEIYNAIQNNVIAAAENEAAGIEQMKFFEVAPNILMTQHAVSVRPICFSMKTLTSLPKDLQDAVIQAGKEAADYERKVESGSDSEILARLEAAGRLKRIPFEDRAAMQKLAEPVMLAYAKEVDASGIHTAIASA
ncbi:TRAP transporter substrate-binding protein [Bosea sp. BH3]|uniref:TRAP transporter substrate-binding protein n=1 Tax=Bosea sp. BH3 TaxID=2871701 RepID=UPI0021CB02E7|nr:TRAP transporter substrate-binding protein [Bosea sp. BH3]MCU4179482.1 TRAP transporter substrate-binding protein [Bosea sp. BH3]